MLWSVLQMYITNQKKHYYVQMKKKKVNVLKAKLVHMLISANHTDLGVKHIDNSQAGITMLLSTSDDIKFTIGISE